MGIDLAVAIAKAEGAKCVSRSAKLDLMPTALPPPVGNCGRLLLSLLMQPY